MSAQHQIREWEKRRQEIIAFLTSNHFISGDPSNSRPPKAEQFFPLKAYDGRKLKIACILDEFSFESYGPECSLFQLTPDNWKEEVDALQPDMFFFESAWKGKDGLWYRKIDRYSDELFALTSYLKEKAVPIVFWNKEDPVYTDIFMLAASYADCVFTTDIDCIARYKADLGHDRIYHLHFAAQPAVHNPIEKYERKDKLCFAGAYYHKYTERTAVFDKFSEYFIQRNGMDIYDRNYGNARPEHAFPQKYNPYILGRLEPSEIDKAYKGYAYGINMNSIQQSQTMFARRVFELLACNTVTVGNYSRGVKNYFGDLTISTDDEKALQLALTAYCKDDITYRKYRLLGLRAVLSEHLYEDRLDYIARKVYGKSIKRAAPKITVISCVANDNEAKRIQKMFLAQTWQNKELLLVGKISAEIAGENIRVISSDEANKLHISNLGKTDFVAYFSNCDWYGPNYLKDLALTCRYGTFDAIGKAAYYAEENGMPVLRNSNAVYRDAEQLALRRAIAVPSLLGKYTLSKLCNAEFSRERLFAVDEFNYCENCTCDECVAVADLPLADKGLPYAQITETAEAIQTLEEHNCLRFKGTDLADFAKSNGKKSLTFNVENNILHINSQLPEGQHEYVYLMKQKVDILPWLEDGKLPVCFSGAGNLDLICVLMCFDANGTKLNALFPKLNRNERLVLPEGTVSVVIGFRPKGPGFAQIKEIVFGAKNVADGIATYLLRSNVLVLANHYPEPNNLYRNMFIHKRMTSYKESGHAFDIMRMNPYAKNGFREFEGINVIEGQGDTLLNILTKGAVDTVCAHFLDAEMWSVLKPFVENRSIKLYIWSHGADIQPWWRRTYNYESESQLEQAKKTSEHTTALWRDVFSVAENNSAIHFIYVSKYFADEVMQDYNVALKPSSYTVIHNMIDTQLFTYQKKDPALRKKIVTIKPFASAKYANDLTTKGILELSQRPCFKDVEIDIYGSGEMFDTDTAALKKFTNINLHKTFLTQKEIAAVHKNAGVFIATTRWDSHGVSRDEAMSSGLVPIAHSCSAIPEFVDDTCGILIPAESYVELADAIEKLYNDPDLFTELSAAAAKRVRSQTAKEFTVDKELALILSKN